MTAQWIVILTLLGVAALASWVGAMLYPEPEADVASPPDGSGEPDEGPRYRLVWCEAAGDLIPERVEEES